MRLSSTCGICRGVASARPGRRPHLALLFQTNLLTFDPLLRLYLTGTKMQVFTALVFIAAGLVLSPAVFPSTRPTQPQSTNLSDEIPSACPVTKPLEHPFIPPAPYPSAGAFSMGNEKLWTNIPPDVAWLGLSHYTPDDPRFRQKLFWWSNG